MKETDDAKTIILEYDVGQKWFDEVVEVASELIRADTHDISPEEVAEQAETLANIAVLISEDDMEILNAIQARFKNK